MATYYLSNADITAGVLDTLATSAPSSADATSGWTVDKKAAPNFCIWYPNTLQALGAFVTTEPSIFSAYGYRTAAALTGSFATGTWVLDCKVRAGATYYAQTGTVRFRLWRSVNADGSGATQITAGWTASTTVTFTAADQDQAKSITSASITGFSMSAEYLFLEIEWSATTSGGNNAAVVYWKHNEGAAEQLVTPTFSTSETVSATRLLTVFASGTSMATRAVEVSGADAQAGTRTLNAYAADLQAALRTLAAYGAEGVAATRNTEAYAAAAAAAERLAEAYGAALATGLRDAESWGADPQATSRTLAAWAALASTATRGLETWGVDDPFVQLLGSAFVSGSSNQIVVTITADMTAGNSIIVVVKGSSGGIVTSATSSKGHTFVVDKTYTLGAAGASIISCLNAATPLVTNDTVTITLSGAATNQSAIVAEYTGLTGTRDQSGKNANLSDVTSGSVVSGG